MKKDSLLFPSKEIKLSELKGKRIAVDADRYLYQFLSGKPTLDKMGRVTNHLTNLFFNTVPLLAIGIKPAFVFDGPFLEIKKHEKFVRETTQPRPSSILTLEKINEAKQLITAMGLPVIQSPAEGKAQASHMCTKGDIYAVISIDYKPLVYFGKKAITNFFQQLKKGAKPRSMIVMQYDLKDVLAELKLDYNQFVMFYMLIGTDFNPPVEGLNPRLALRVVQKYKTFTRIFEKVKWQYGYLPKAVYEHIKTMPVTNKYHLHWNSLDETEIIRILVQERNVDQKKVIDALNQL